MLRDFMVDHAGPVLVAGGLLIGLVFGALAYRTNFCTMGALADARTFGDRRRLHAWLLAIAVAMGGTQVLTGLGLLAIDKSMYVGPTVNWAGAVLGGLMFGYGMVFAGGCATRNATRFGGGDLRGLMSLVLIGVFGYMAIGGVFAPARAAIESATAVRLPSAMQTLPSLLGLPASGSGAVLGVLVALVLAVVAFSHKPFRTSPLHLVSGLGVGLAVVAGWALTGLAFDELSDKPVAPVSLTFVRPAGDTLEWLGRFTALGLPGFGVASLAGTVMGAFLAALASGRFRVVGFSGTDDTVRHLVGAALMGVGGVLATGCTIGQGITGVSTLAVTSLLALAAIVAGGWLGLAAMERGLEAAA
ncbi:MAG: YeeE/YedE family protein [Hyphomicrobiaceae bacterium]